MNTHPTTTPAQNTAHTPTPYFAQRALCVSGSFRPWSAEIRSRETGRAVATVYGNTKDEAEAQAAFIVRACNSHAALVEAMEALYYAGNSCDPRHEARFEAMFDKARAALAAAKGGAK